MEKHRGIPDTVEVVRCRECKHSRPLNEDEKMFYLDTVIRCECGEIYSHGGYGFWWAHDYCSYGERMDEE